MSARPDDWSRVREAFEGALALPADARPAYLSRTCGGDAALRQQVEALLASHERAKSFLEAPAGPLATIAVNTLSLEGQRVGSYQLSARIGAGGMGEVYRARDVRLGRDVAIKVLPPLFTADPERLARFEREARMLAALNHPHIAAIYGVEDADPSPDSGQAAVRALVLEMVEGETLAERLQRGPVSVTDALTIARQIADALDAAHEKGIVHRDLKPANVKITPDGVVKVLDFGLAKAAGGDSTPDLSESPTLTVVATREGIILGTAAYMSPEQANGRAVDKRADLWAFGAVLYELLTGRRAFTGEGVSDILAHVLMTEPDWTALPANTPASIRQLLRRCLQKDRKRRLADAADARLEIDDALASPAVDAAAIAVRAPWRRVALVGVAASAIALAGGIYVLQQRGARSVPAASAPATGSLQDLEITQLTTSGNTSVPAISPDGKYVAYLQRGKDGTSLWIRQTASPSDVRIVAPQPGVQLHGATVTPDSSFVDFLRSEGRGPGSLWRVPFLGGSARKLIDDVVTLPGWSPDGRQMAFVRRQSMLIVADADGGHERVVVAAKAPAPRFNGLPVLGSLRPAWSPDGRLIALVAFDNQGAGVRGLVAFVNADDGSQQIVEVTGIWGLAWLDSSSVVLSRAGGPGLPVQLWRLSYPRGELSRLTNDLGSYRGVSVTPDRRALVTARTETRVGIWIGDGAARDGVDLQPITLGSSVIEWYGLTWAADRLVYPTYSRGRQVLSIVTPDGTTTDEIGLSAMWLTATSDGRTLVYPSLEYAGLGSLWRADVDGRRAIKLVPDNSASPVVTPDDRSVLYVSNTRTGTNSLWMVPLEGGAPTQLVKGPLANIDVSPDGKSMAFISHEDPNRPALVVCDLPTCSTSRTLPAPARARLRWTRDGSGIAYVGPGSNLWVIPLDGKPPSQLTRFTDGQTIADFAWSRDGKRLAIARATVTDDIVLLKGLR